MPVPEDQEEGAFIFPNRFFKFVGETRQGQPAGHGAFFFADGGVLEGVFQGGELSCEDGCRRWPDGSTYLGPLRDGEPHGAGRYIGVAGDVYTGEFACGLRSGDGVLVRPDLRYEGKFAAGAFEGAGVLRRGCDVITGEFARGVPAGAAVAEYASGDRYDGDWVDGAPHGQGVFRCAATGLTYTGPFHRGRRAGDLPDAVQLLELRGAVAREPSGRRSTGPGPLGALSPSEVPTVVNGTLVVKLRYGREAPPTVASLPEEPKGSRRRVSRDPKVGRRSLPPALRPPPQVVPDTSETGRQVVAVVTTVEAEDNQAEVVAEFTAPVVRGEVCLAVDVPATPEALYRVSIALDFRGGVRTTPGSSATVAHAGPTHHMLIMYMSP